MRLRAERRAHRTERAAQITSLAALSLLFIAATLFLFLAYTGWQVALPCKQLGPLSDGIV